MAYLAASLVALRNSANVAFPKRDKSSDGWIGNAAHQKNKSEHNPDSKGCVHAIDVDIDDGNPGRDLRKELLAATIGHRAVWYVISNGIIYSRSYSWKARKYTGPNGHFKHVHVSIRVATDAEHDTSLVLRKAAAPAKPPAAGTPTGTHKLGARVLKKGDKGNDVAFVQRFLGLTADGIFGAKTEAEVKRYQGIRSLNRDGIVGALTWKPMIKAAG